MHDSVSRGSQWPTRAMCCGGVGWLKRWGAIATITLLIAAACGDAEPAHTSVTAQSRLTCSTVEMTAGAPNVCVIQVRNALDEPTTAFRADDFVVSVDSSNSEARLTISALERGADVTTLTFTVSASLTTVITIRVSLRGPTGTLQPIHGSGCVASVLSWPAATLGPIACDAPAGEIVLRHNTTCTAATYDGSGYPALLRPGDIHFHELSGFGSFDFVGGKGSLTFVYTAPMSVAAVEVGMVEIHAVLLTTATTTAGTSQQLQLPVVLPDLFPVAKFCSLQCAQDTPLRKCMLVVADEVGPVRFNASHMRWRIMMLRHSIGQDGSIITEPPDGSEEVLENSRAFVVSIVPGSRGDTGLVTWSPAVDDTVAPHQLHISVAGASTAEVTGSPVRFLSCVRPTAAYTAFRGCAQRYITAGAPMTCLIDFLPGVTGDPRYFAALSTLNAVITNMTFIRADPVFQAPVVQFTYTAPTVQHRTDDYITVKVAGHDALHSPFHVSVYPTGGAGGAHDGGAAPNPVSRGDNAAMIGVGLLFYGGVLLAGMARVIHRSQKRRRIQRQRRRRLRDAQGPTGGEVQSLADAVAATPAVRVGGGLSAATPPVPASPVPPALHASGRASSQQGELSSRAAVAVGSCQISNGAVKQQRRHVASSSESE